MLKLKYFDRIDLAKPLAGFLYQAALPYLREIDYFVPIPLHWRRLWRRRYNQATELAHQLSRLTKIQTGREIPVLHNVLLRIKHTESQGTKSYPHRLRNMQGAFAVRGEDLVESKNTLKGKRIALIDDVYTTGATIKGCAKALERTITTDHIYAFTVARVIRGERYFGAGEGNRTPV